MRCSHCSAFSCFYPSCLWFFVRIQHLPPLHVFLATPYTIEHIPTDRQTAPPPHTHTHHSWWTKGFVAVVEPAWRLRGSVGSAFTWKLEAWFRVGCGPFTLPCRFALPLVSVGENEHREDAEAVAKGSTKGPGCLFWEPECFTGTVCCVEARRNVACICDFFYSFFTDS